MISHAPNHALTNTDPIANGRIGRFIMEREIGQGSVGTVYLFRDPLIGRKVAIKVLNPQLPSDQRRLFEKHFIQEARAAGRLNHPNIVTVYDADKTDDLLFIAMEFLEGQELRDMLGTEHQFSYKQIADLIARIANALDYAHRNGVIHRDIKPANIFIVGKSTPKVLDFGIASASRQLSDPDATVGHDTLADCRLLGTPSYMSPEQARGEIVDARTDIFSLGVVLYQLLCGKLPFSDDSIKGLLEKISREAPVPPQEIRPDVPLRLAHIAAKALAKKPADRYSSAAEMANDLNRFLAKERTNQIIAKMQQPGEDGAPPMIRVPADKMPVAAAVKPASRLPLFIGGGLLVVAGAIAWAALHSPVPVAPADRLQLQPASLLKGEESSAPIKLAQAALPAPPAIPSASAPAASVPSPAASAAASTVAAAPEAPKSPPTPAKNPFDPTPVKPASKPKPVKPATPVATLAATGTVLIAVSPWGEVYVDGSAKGVAPPLSRLSLSTGAHRIEIRNGEDRHVVNVEVTPEKETRVGHRF